MTISCNGRGYNFEAITSTPAMQLLFLVEYFTMPFVLFKQQGILTNYVKLNRAGRTISMISLIVISR